MDWQRAAPGIILLLVKLTGTTLFVVFIPHTFPRGNFSFVHEGNWTENLPEVMSTFPARATAASPNPAPAPMKPPKWKRYRGSDYWFSEDVTEWINSQIQCEAQRADLVIINDRKELEFIANNTATTDYFIGLGYSVEENRWVWSDKTEPKSNLFRLQPNEMEKECATVRAGEVSPALCYQESRWICEKSR